jgi:hypothetical protein
MPKFILRFLALSVLCAAGAFGQIGTFAQIAYGGSWQTTFTLMNLDSTDPVTLTLSFFNDDGSPLNAPVQGSTVTAAYTFTIPPSGAQNVVLSGSPVSTTEGWASLSMTSASGGPVRGQASFRFVLPTGTISEAVVPLSIPGSALCIVPFPQFNPVILIPFDNTTGQNYYVTSLAFANITASNQTYPIEFDDQSGNPLVTDSLALTPGQHIAFVSTKSYPALEGQKGILRIHSDPATLTVLGLLSNSTGAISTIIPVTQ